MVAVESAQHHGPLRRDANNIADMIEPCILRSQGSNFSAEVRLVQLGL